MSPISLASVSTNVDLHFSPQRLSTVRNAFEARLLVPAEIAEDLANRLTQQFDDPSEAPFRADLVIDISSPCLVSQDDAAVSPMPPGLAEPPGLERMMSIAAGSLAEVRRVAQLVAGWICEPNGCGLGEPRIVPAGNDPVSVRFAVPRPLVGMVIGRSGSNIRITRQMHSGCQIHISPLSYRTRDRVITISSTSPHAIFKALDALIQQVNKPDVEMSGPVAMSCDRPYHPAWKPEESNHPFRVPSEPCAFSCAYFPSERATTELG